MNWFSNKQVGVLEWGFWEAVRRRAPYTTVNLNFFCISCCESKNVALAERSLI